MKKNPYVNRVEWYDGFSIVLGLLVIACVLYCVSIHEVETYTLTQPSPTWNSYANSIAFTGSMA